MGWWTRQKPPVGPSGPDDGNRNVKTEGLWSKCEKCTQIVWRKALEEGMNVCPKCGHHFRLDAQTRMKYLFDGPWEEFDRDLISSDPLQFVDSKSYKDRLAS